MLSRSVNHEKPILIVFYGNNHETPGTVVKTSQKQVKNMKKVFDNIALRWYLSKAPHGKCGTDLEN
jgi:hypothetical protein